MMAGGLHADVAGRQAAIHVFERFDMFRDHTRESFRRLGAMKIDLELRLHENLPISFSS
jgi:hypothetical protein